MIKTAEALTKLLAQPDGGTPFAILDGASVPDIRMRLHETQPEHVCLYRGELKPDMEEVAPYLVKLEPGTKFTDSVIQEGWGKHWGVFAVSSVDLDFLRRHFRAFLVVHNSDAKPMLFRYYDPRVLRVFLPTCTEDELRKFFGPVGRYIMEAEDPRTALTFEAKDGKLKQQQTVLGKE